MQISHRLFDKSYVFICSPADLREVRSQAGLSVTNSENLEVSEVPLMKELPLFEVRPHRVWQRGLGRPSCGVQGSVWLCGGGATMSGWVGYIFYSVLTFYISPSGAAVMNISSPLSSSMARILPFSYFSYSSSGMSLNPSGMLILFACCLSC